MFERFTHSARAVVVEAQRQARRLGHDHIGCEHLLLAVAAAEGPAGAALRGLGVTPTAVEEAVSDLVGRGCQALDADALADVGIDLDAVLRKVEAAFGPDALSRLWRPTRPRRWRRHRESGSGHIPFTSRAKRCLEGALRESLALRHNHIGVEHIALALTAMPDGTVPRLLPAIGASAAQLRCELLDRFRRAA
jgi:ATP-dependent Clp protease ATP-binding subunit ClpA